MSQAGLEGVPAQLPNNPTLSAIKPTVGTNADSPEIPYVHG
jgi:hypothetical protein